MQQKYGHIIERPAIAPPPTGATPFSAAPAMPPPQMAPPAAVGGAQIYNRYVPYDAHNNTAAPVPVPMATSYAPGAPSAVAPPPTIYPPSTPTPAPFPNQHMHINTTQNAPSTPSESSPPLISNRLLGNKAVFSPPGDAEIVNLGTSSSSVL